MPVVAKVVSEQLNTVPSSGTVAFTVIDTIKVIEHATRRTGIAANTLTPENLDAAYDNLYLILTSMTNRGVNLWCVEQVLVALYKDKAKYSMPQGTVEVMDVTYRTNTPLAPVWTNQASMKAATLTAPVKVKHVGMLLTAPGSYRFAFEALNATGGWIKVGEKTVFAGAAAGEWLWLDIEVPLESTQFRIREQGGLPFFTGEIVLASDSTELTMHPYNRDDYLAISNKNIAGRPLNYLYEKQITPILTLWPVPDNTRDVLVITRQRQVQDVGSLMAKLEIPERWYECIIWMLAKNLAFELPNVAPERIQLCTNEAANSLREAELGESDGAPLRILPNISGYTA